MAAQASPCRKRCASWRWRLRRRGPRLADFSNIETNSGGVAQPAEVALLRQERVGKPRNLGRRSKRVMRKANTFWNRCSAGILTLLVLPLSIPAQHSTDDGAPAPPGIL